MMMENNKTCCSYLKFLWTHERLLQQLWTILAYTFKDHHPYPEVLSRETPGRYNEP
jgi:hypothetical protein